MSNVEHMPLKFEGFFCGGGIVCFFSTLMLEACRLKCVCQPAGLLEGSPQDGQWQLFIFSLADLSSPLYNVE